MLDERIWVLAVVIPFLILCILLVSLALTAFLTWITAPFSLVSSVLRVGLLLTVVVVVIVPGLWRAGIALGQYEDEVLCAQPDALARICDHVSDCLCGLLVRSIPPAVRRADPAPALRVLELLIVDFLLAIEANRDHEPSRGQVIKQV